VIGVPIKTSSLNGLDSLLSIVQMPSGIPVATVAINGAENAALLAIAILSTSDENLARKLKEYREEMKKKVEEKAEKLDNLGYKAYIENFLTNNFLFHYKDRANTL
jgi:5-(carboxyamino)imidazole ribonucleotide mutase